MRSVTPMRAAKTGYIIMSVLLCVLGVVLFVWPGVSVAVIGELLGIGMIVFGAVKVAGYLSRDLFRLAFQYDLAFGLLLRCGNGLDHGWSFSVPFLIRKGTKRILMKKHRNGRL